ncbi:cytochrome P450 [Kribbella sp. NPDC054772]
MKLSLRSELQQTISMLHAVREYDRDRLGYIERQRIQAGKNFFVGDGNLIVTDGKLAKKLLAETNRANHIDDGMYLRTKPIDTAKAATEEWAPARSAAHKQMRRKQVDDHASMIRDSFSGYLDRMHGRPVDVVSCLKLASGHAMSELILGQEDARGIPELIESAVEANLPIMNSSRLVPRWFPTPKMRAHLRNTGRLRSVLAATIDRRSLAAADSRGEDSSLLGVLCRDGRLTPEQLRSAVQVSLLASFGVPGAATAWSLLAIKSSAQLEALARDEAESVQVVDDLAQRAPVIAAIVNEALRMYPPAWMISRLITEPCAVDSLTIPRGTTANIVIYSIHRDEEEWDRPHSFEPGRWLEPDRWRKGTYIPFGSGPRVCIGSHLGIIEIMTMLWTFLRGYDLEVAQMHPEPTVRALLTPRTFTGRILKINE